MRKTPFVEGEYYHIYNRGVDKRNIFSDSDDLERFFLSMLIFNSAKPIGSFWEFSFKENKLKGGDLGAKHPSGSNSLLGCLAPKKERLVDFVSYCLNPNHFHFILTQSRDGGISEFMKRLGGGYTNYFNEKFDRTGSLFQGTFKSKLIHSNEYLLHVSAYVNLNNRIHQWDEGLDKLTKSSWYEYIGKSKEVFCNKDIILGQFREVGEYEKFARSSLEDIIKRKQEEKELKSVLID